MPETTERELFILGLGDATRGELVSSYLSSAGYKVRPANLEDLAEKPLGVLLDLSPSSADGWGILLDIKKNPATRDIPVLPLFLSEEGRVGGIFPAAGFFILPIEGEYLTTKLAVFGLTEEAETYDLQVLMVSRKGEDEVFKTLRSVGFEIENAYTGKEGLALATITPPYIAFVSLMLADMSAFELLEKFRLYPQLRNLPFFVLMKDSLKEGEKKALSREIASLVRKKELSREEFLGYFRRRG